ncbi:TIGR03364 family FAD-dependent oxidoreductase [Thermoleptolyngbya sp. PKUAC-SCTB121]|uniref:TIGR03364 family FAD-dependent oxidoreductase n=1 Tax=Thermoleptolyngbya sp. PKUAC-SCTB121 TaxID=2811482 RepID=UPI0019648D56|nr:TIGR03364 family FAD-dependent oxidoreductase [Thermoleptolyngbya sp. PKUAC-SCTB121]
MSKVEVIVVGAGIVGLAHALAAAKRGRQVVVFERNTRAIGASIRNFGMVWPIGQPQGALYARALKSRQIWLEAAEGAGFGIEECGSLHLAYRADELAVLEEFVAANRAADSIQLLTADEVAQKSAAAVTEGLLGALWSATEMTVDPREAIAQLPDYLAAKYGVAFRFGEAVTAIAHPQVLAGGKPWSAEEIFVCSGADFETLYPDLYAASGLTKVKLQMMRTGPQPNGWRIGPSLCAGLTLTHYAAFADCPSLPALKQRIATETPFFPKWGIHVMMSQNRAGELVLGDSHEYGLSPDPFDRAEVNQAVLEYLRGFARAPSFSIAETWHGIYAKLPGQVHWIQHPEPGVTVVNALSGAGMTLSFGLAEEVLDRQVLV